MNESKKLLQQGQLMSVIVVSLIAAVVIIGLSLKKKPKVMVMQATADQAAAIDTLDRELPVEDYYPEIKAVFHQPGRLELYADSRLYTIARDSIGWTDPFPTVIDAQLMQLNQILYENDQAVMSGNLLQLIDLEYSDISNEFDFGSPVNVILKFGEGYLVGTNTGLYYYDEDRIDTVLKEDIMVSSLTEDVGGLWVGTFGDGLWRFDGDKWQRRYLLRDTSIFDFVIALEYSYPFLWVGTPSGIFRFDGGSWNQLFVSDSSEVYEVNCFLPRVFKTYIGTEQGLFVFANDSLKAVPEFEAEQVSGLFKDNKDIIVATRHNGIFSLKGKEAILRPEQLAHGQWELADTK